MLQIIFFVIITTCIYFGDVKGVVITLSKEESLHDTLSVDFVASLPEVIPISLQYLDADKHYLRSHMESPWVFLGVHDIYYRNNNETTSDWTKIRGGSMTNVRRLRIQGDNEDMQEFVFVSKSPNGTYVRSMIVDTPGQDITYKYPTIIHSDDDDVHEMRKAIKMSPISDAIFEVDFDQIPIIYSQFVQLEGLQGERTWIEVQNSKSWPVLRRVNHDMEMLYKSRARLLVFLGIEDRWVRSDEERWVRSDIVVIHKDRMEIIDSSEAALPDSNKDDLGAMATISDVDLVAMTMELRITTAQAPNVTLSYNGSAFWTVYVQKTGDTTWYHYDFFGSRGRLLPSQPTEFVYDLQDLYHDTYAKFVFVGVLSMDEDRWIRSNIVVIGGEKSFMDYGWIALIAVAFVCCFGAIAIVVNAHNHSVETKQPMHVYLKSKKK
eukprot:274285_1